MQTVQKHYKTHNPASKEIIYKKVTENYSFQQQKYFISCSTMDEGKIEKSPMYT